MRKTKQTPSNVIMGEDDKLIGIFIRGFEFWKPHKIIFNPIVTVYLVDKTSGESFCKVSYTVSKDLLLTSFISWRHEVFTHTPSSGLEKGPFYLDEKITTLDSNQKLLFFEISRILTGKRNAESGKSRIAWAYLVPVASDGTKNVDKALKLQLYKVPKKCKISHDTCKIYHLYKDHKLKPFSGVINVKVKAVTKEETTSRPKEEPSPAVPQPKEELKKSTAEELIDMQFTQKMLQWSRLPTQSCKIPNELHMVIHFGRRGTSGAHFSRTGKRLAVSASEKIFIYDIFTWSEVLTLRGHNGFIYDMDWTEDDRYLLSSSNDCTSIVWHLSGNTEETEKHVLPHPSFVYCGKWVSSGSELVTGCKDHIMRFWTRTRDSFELKEEIRGHSGFVTSIALHGSSTIISGDSKGCIIVRSLRGEQWTVMKRLELNETSNGIIDSIHVCSTGARIIVTSRSKGSFMIDLKSSIIMQKYKAMGNVVLRSVPCLSPCGSLFFAFCQNGEIGVWNAHTGKHLTSYESLFQVKGLSEICGSIDYNPFEHMMAIGALDHDYPLLILKYGENGSSSKGFPKINLYRSENGTV